MTPEHEANQAASAGPAASGVAITRLTVLSWSISLVCTLGLAVFAEGSALRLTGWVLLVAFLMLIFVAVRNRK